MAASHFPSRNAALPHFVKRLGAAARANVSRDKHKVIAPRTLGNLVGQGEALLDFMDDPRFRRWANALRTELAAGAKRRFWREVRAVLKDDKPGDLSELAAQADQAEAYRSAAEQALLGDRWPDSFITFEK
jgi:hypothetical protein